MSRDAEGFRISTADEQRRSMDPYAHAQTMISEEHRMIHDGFMFDASGIEATVANAGTLDLLIKVPAGYFPHVTLVEFQPSDAALQVDFFEGTTVSADGSAVNTRNHNRAGTPNDSPNTTIFQDPTVTADGTNLHTRHIPDPGGPPGRDSGQLVAGGDVEWVLGHPTLAKNYLWRLTNNSGGAITCGYHINFYEIGYTS